MWVNPKDIDHWITVEGSKIPVRHGQSDKAATEAFIADKRGKESEGKHQGNEKAEAGEKKEKAENKDSAPEKKVPTVKVVKVDLGSDIQKQLTAAQTSKERQKIAFKYIMEKLKGKYSAEDGRVVEIDRLGADKITHKDIEVKLRVSPELANLIKAGTLEGVVEAKKDGGQPHKRFTHFAYYKVRFQIGKEKFVGRLNVGIREDGRSTLYDLNPFNKE